MTVELTMSVLRSEGNRLSGTVRLFHSAETRSFSGMLELMRVFEELVPLDRDASAEPATRRFPRA